MTSFIPMGIQSYPDETAPGRFYRRQFILHRGTVPPIAGWCRLDQAGWVLDYDPEIGTTLLVDRTGTAIGLVLGVAVDRIGALVDGMYQLDTDPRAHDFADVVRTFAEGCAGRYVILILSETLQSLVMDPVGDLAVVYNPDEGIVATNPFLCIDRPFIDNPKIPFSFVREGKMAYSLGHTRDRDVKRLFGNHALDLRTLKPSRIWPSPSTDLSTKEGQESEIMAKITARLREICRTILETRSCIFPLSGGRDSRCLLGAALPSIRNANFLFSWRFHKMSGLDTQAAKAICVRLGLEHREYGNEQLSRDQKMAFFRRTGFGNFGPELQSLAISEDLPPGHIVLRGNIMGILRATNWQRQEEGRLRTSHAIRRLRIMPSDQRFRGWHERWLEEFTAWYDTLPDQGQAKVYDMLWLDIVLTHGQGARNHGLPKNFIVNPFNDRKLLALSMQLPVAYRRINAAYDAIARATLPDLDDIAYV